MGSVVEPLEASQDGAKEIQKNEIIQQNIADGGQDLLNLVAEIIVEIITRETDGCYRLHKEKQT